MAVQGRKPKPPGEAINRNKPVHDWVEVRDVPFAGGPDLDPEFLDDDEVWKGSTVAWWGTVRQMPHCVVWTPAEWVNAQLTALTMNRSGAESAEFRMRCKTLGTSADALRDLRIRYVSAAAADDGENVTQINDYRSL